MKLHLYIFDLRADVCEPDCASSMHRRAIQTAALLVVVCQHEQVEETYVCIGSALLLL